MADSPPSRPDASRPTPADAAAPRWSFLGRMKSFVNLFGSRAADRDSFRGGDFTAPYVIMEDGTRRKPRVLFVDTGNTARSQMAEAFAGQYGFHAESAGTFPVQALPHEIAQVMVEKGIRMEDQVPKLLDLRRLEAFDRVILFEATLPSEFRRHPNVEEWNVMDPTGFPLEGYRLVRDQTEKAVRRLARNWMRKVKPRSSEAPVAAT